MKYSIAGISLRYFVLSLSVITVIVVNFLGIIYKIPYMNVLEHPISVSSIIILIILMPFGVADFAEQKRKETAEKRLPDFLRDLAGFTNFGTPMSEAILKASETNYGPLNEEIDHIAGMIKLGIPVETAIEDFGTRIKSKNIKMTGDIIKKASEAGSNTSDVVSLVSSFATQTYLMRESRYADMRSYSTTLATSFGVFLFVIIMLDLYFFPKLSASGLSSSSALNFTSSSSYIIEKIFSAGIIVQSVASGLISGVFRDGRVVSGSMLAGILTLISIVVLAIVGVL